jgi:alpha-glucosidase
MSQATEQLGQALESIPILVRGENAQSARLNFRHDVRVPGPADYPPMWWERAVVYQVYPRSFQDSDGDGLGDLSGVGRRLDHVAGLGADAVWLSPFYPSPDHDFGYDVSDFRAVDPRFGTMRDFDDLLAQAHGLGFKVLMDLVPCHTSIEHPWFHERPDFYFLRDTLEPPNNWRAAFGGPAWSRDPHGRGWYLHSFFPEQPDLDWRNPEVVVAMQDVIRFWLDRGVDGFRLDALDRLMKDPELRDDPPATGPPPLPLDPDHATLEHVHSLNAPDIDRGIAALREAAGDHLLVGEVYLPTDQLGPYLRHLDLAFCFDLYHSRFEPKALRGAIDTAVASRRLAWVLSNHDFQRLPNRVGRENVALAALLLLTLPGCAFIYQGDELGLPDGPGSEVPLDRFGRDRFRHPMPWTDEKPNCGFTSGEPWLSVARAPGGSVQAQQRDPRSLLHIYRGLIALRRELTGDEIAFDDASPDGVLAYRRGDHEIVLNISDAPVPAPAGEIVLTTNPVRPHQSRILPPRTGIVVRLG